jgi:gliding motility-associated-like protein
MVNFQNESTNGIKYIWEFGDGLKSGEIDPTHVYTSPGTYMVTLTAIDEQGCASQVIHGPYVIFSPDLFIPNVFSPNGDGVNDIFLVRYTGSQPFQMEIFDRWGVRMSQTRNKNKGWDGTDLKGQNVADGIYYYKVNVGDREFAGPVTLVR